MCKLDVSASSVATHKVPNLPFQNLSQKPMKYLCQEGLDITFTSVYSTMNRQLLIFTPTYSYVYIENIQYLFLFHLYWTMTNSPSNEMSQGKIVELTRSQLKSIVRLWIISLNSKLYISLSSYLIYVDGFCLVTTAVFLKQYKKGSEVGGVLTCVSDSGSLASHCRLPATSLQ